MSHRRVAVLASTEIINAVSRGRHETRHEDDAEKLNKRVVAGIAGVAELVQGAGLLSTGGESVPARGRGFKSHPRRQSVDASFPHKDTRRQRALAQGYTKKTAHRQRPDGLSE